MRIQTFLVIAASVGCASSQPSTSLRHGAADSDLGRSRQVLGDAKRCLRETKGVPLPSTAARPSRDVIREYGTSLDNYQLEGGLWIDELALLVNEEFDFALAQAIEGAGPAIAARRRLDRNSEKTAHLRSSSADPVLRAMLDGLRSCGVHVYFVLWGRPEHCELRMVMDSMRDIADPAPVPGSSRYRTLMTRSLSEWTREDVLVRSMLEGLRVLP